MMMRTRSTYHPANCQTAQTRRGAVLVLVVFFIFLAGALSVLITANSVQLVRTTRNYHESILLRQMADSAYAWLATRSNWRADVPVEFDMKAAPGTGASGRIRMYTDHDVPEVVVVSVRLMLEGCQLSRTLRFRSPS